MMDFYDSGARLELLDREMALSLRKEEGPPATGCCLYCDEPLPEGQRWCDEHCRDDWTTLLRAQRQRPLP